MKAITYNTYGLPDMLELKEIDIQREGEKLWQVGQNRPRKNVTISDEIKKRGFVSVGRVVIDKSSGKKTFRGADGYFEEQQKTKGIRGEKS